MHERSGVRSQQAESIVIAYVLAVDTRTGATIKFINPRKGKKKSKRNGSHQSNRTWTADAPATI